MTVDALHTQRAVAQAIIDAGGDYIMLVKENQPELHADIVTLFSDLPTVQDTLTQAQTTDAGHGRIETRTLIASTALVGYSDWPGLQQVFRLEHKVRVKKTGAQHHETTYGVTSLPPPRADARRLLLPTRGHWRVEAGHWIRDVTFDEDRSQVRCGHIPQVMAALRNTTIAVLRRAGERGRALPTAAARAGRALPTAPVLRGAAAAGTRSVIATSRRAADRDPAAASAAVRGVTVEAVPEPAARAAPPAWGRGVAAAVAAVGGERLDTLSKGPDSLAAL